MRGMRPMSHPVYSPSQTEKFLQCPRLWQLGKRWEPRGQEWTPNMTLGTAIHAGLESWVCKAPGDFDAALAVALASLSSEFVEGSTWTLDGCAALVERGLREAVKVDIVGTGHVVGCELVVEPQRLDLVVRQPDGLEITDYKVALSLDKRKLEYRIRAYDPSWQLLENAWGVWAKYGDCPVRAQVLILALTPRPFTYIHRILITPERIEEWERGAVSAWHVMERIDVGLEQPWMNTRACHDYNRKCDFYDYCHVLHGDEAMAETLYDRKVSD